MSIPLILSLSLLAPTEPTADASSSGAPAASAWPEWNWAEAPTSFEAQNDPPSSASDHVFVDENAWYIHLMGGLVSTTSADGPGEEIDFDEGFLLGIGFGHHFGAQEERFGFDLELELLSTDQDTSGEISSVRDYNSLSLLLNGLVDIRIFDRLFFYGGPGIGAGFVDVSTSDDTLGDFDSDDGPYLAWQLKGGLLYRFNESVSANFGYRFCNISDIEIEDSVGTNDFDLSTEQHILELGVAFSF